MSIYNSDIPTPQQQVAPSMDVYGALRVEGIENWIFSFQVTHQNADISNPFLRVVDPKTGAKFEIRRVE